MAVSRDASRAADIGRTLGGRYRLVAPLGAGASATVYLAEDVMLARKVAVKVLHPSLAADAAFLKRFRAEAQAAAALSHPHVVAVFDWGTDQGLEGGQAAGEWAGAPYLVTEYLAGGSLRAMLDRGRLLTPSQALMVGLETCRGLEYAHAQGLVHRDIKPANLLFGDDGRLRIADFGLARAIAEAAWTEPAGVVLGTARYASPEQARGQSVDGHTDVYSLALTLVESVTGSVPFAADTTVATLMGRIDKLLPVSAELGQLAPVLERAGRPDPAERFDAPELARALVGIARLMPRPAPLPLVRASAFDRVDESPTSLSPPTTIAAGDGPPPVGAQGSPPAPRFEEPVPPVTIDTASRWAGPAPAPPLHPDPAVPSDAPPRPAVAAAPEPAVASPARAPGGPRHRPRRLLAVLAVAVLAGLGAVGFLLLRPGSPKSYAVTDYVGQRLDQVSNAIGPYGWDVQPQEVFDETVEPGVVVRQNPTGGSLRRGEQLVLWASKGPEPRGLPEVKALTRADAEAALAGAGLVAKVVGEAFDEVVAPGVVISWSVADHPEYAVGQKVVKGTEVQIVVSKGPQPRSRPSLKDLTWEQADAKLKDLGLVAVRQPDEHSDTVGAGIVSRVEPAVGAQLNRGDPVNVWISLGPQLFDVPNLVGMSIEDAKAAIVTGGIFSPGTVTGPITGTVVAASPGAGEKQRRGTVINLTLG